MRDAGNVPMMAPQTRHMPGKASRECHMPSTSQPGAPPRDPAIVPNEMAPPIALPAGYVGPAWLPGTGRMIWWTGRVAIGLRHEAPSRVESSAQSSVWVQELMLA
jgi:hypothetical protein